VEVTFLGTGTPRHLDRASAAIAITASPSSNGSAGPGGVVLLDTAGGNEVMRQLRTSGTPVEAVRHVVITHQHFDHAAGLPILLLDASRHDSGPIYVYAPAAGIEVIRQVVDTQAPGMSRRLGERLHWVPMEAGQSLPLEALGSDVTLRATTAVHPVPAMGCVLEWGGRKLGYTGDTAFYEGIGRSYADVDALIHEASGREGPNADAMRAIGHSTGRDAGKAAAAARAGQLILTHFVPDGEAGGRHLVEEAKSVFAGPVTAAQDLLHLTV
jgi:ribonuclease BN (tRNA processing enzyme)